MTGDELTDRRCYRVSGQIPPAHFTLSPNNVHVLAESCGQNMRGENSVGESGMYLVAVFRAIRAVLTHRRYRPELHYMRGPGPKWFERHGR
jgi:hypothetical protein